MRCEAGVVRCAAGPCEVRGALRALHLVVICRSPGCVGSVQGVLRVLDL